MREGPAGSSTGRQGSPAATEPTPPAVPAPGHAAALGGPAPPPPPQRAPSVSPQQLQLLSLMGQLMPAQLELTGPAGAGPLAQLQCGVQLVGDLEALLPQLGDNGAGALLRLPVGGQLQGLLQRVVRLVEQARARQLPARDGEELEELLARLAAEVRVLRRAAGAWRAAGGGPAAAQLLLALQVCTGLQLALQQAAAADGQPDRWELLEGMWQQLARWLEAELPGAGGEQQRWGEQPQRAERAGALLRALHEALAAASGREQLAPHEAARCLQLLGLAVQAWPGAVAAAEAAAGAELSEPDVQGEVFQAACQLLPACLRAQQGGRQALLDALAYYLRHLAEQSGSAASGGGGGGGAGGALRAALGQLAAALRRAAAVPLLAGEEAAVTEAEAAARLEKFGRMWDMVFRGVVPCFSGPSLE